MNQIEIGLLCGAALLGGFGFLTGFLSDEPLWMLLAIPAVLLALVVALHHDGVVRALESPCVRIVRIDGSILNRYDLKVQPDGSCSFLRRSQE